MRRPVLTIPQILKWIDAHYQTTKRWPKRTDGRIPNSLGETWCAIDLALRRQYRGLSYKSSLPQLLEEKRQVLNRLNLPHFSVLQILRWADDHHARLGRWPCSKSGSVLAAPGEQWSKVDKALKNGNRGLKTGISLAQLLYHKRGVRTTYNMPPLTNEKIIRWAKHFYRQKGHWPTVKDPWLAKDSAESWYRISVSLVQGDRGLPGGSSLPRLLSSMVGYRNRKALPTLTVEQIIHWAKRYLHQHGRWPTHLSGAIESTGETWSGVHAALYCGIRGLPGGSSLFRTLQQHLGTTRNARIHL